MLNKTLLDKEKIQLEEALEKVKKELKNLEEKVPKGAKLRVVKNNNVYQYYIRTEKTQKTGTYIKKQDRALAEILAQIEYDQKLITRLSKNINDITVFQDNSFENPFTEARDQLPELKRGMIKMPYISDEDYIYGWTTQDYPQKGFNNTATEYNTKRGIRVRSKSEVIIADILDMLEIPFLYEKPLRLQEGIVHPDFTLLNVKEKKEVYWEHFGMMDDIEYRNHAFNKIRNYENSGYYLNDKLIITFETSKYPISTRSIKNMLEKMKKNWTLH